MTGDETRRLADAGPDAPPMAARAVFADHLGLAQRYVEWLAGAGTARGLIGPREADRLWDRHVLNSAVLADLLPAGARVVDVGSGAGLPGVPMAIRRPDLHVDLVEPMQRRVSFLAEVVADLGIADRVRVIRGRAEEQATVEAAGNADWVVARAVAPLDRLVRWCLPLLSARGTLLALKGATAVDEVARHRGAVRRLGAGAVEVTRVGQGVLDVAAWVVVVSRVEGRAVAVGGGP